VTPEQQSLALRDLAGAWPALIPPNRISVSAGAARSLVIKRPGGASGNWNPLETPYMVDPTNTLASRSFSAVCFVAPAQAGKTVSLGEGWMTHCVLNDPGDMLIVQMNQDKAREYSKQRLDRAIRNSPDLRAMRSASSRDDNTHDKLFRNGMWVRIAWPTASNMSSTSYRYTFGTDYDRWPDNIDGEGDGFTLMSARTRTFLSRGMTCLESSPGRDIEDPSWAPSTPHEAPPVTGILGIYNRSDRRRLYWKCPHCGDWFEAKPGLDLFRLPSEEELLESVRSLDIDTFARQHAVVACPSCGVEIVPRQRDGMNRAILEGKGGWLAEGLSADDRDRITGTPRTSSIAGYWLGGIAATYQSWEGLIRSYVQGLLEYQMTGSETSLMTTVNTGQGMPFMPAHLREAARGLAKGRTTEDVARFIVPDAARFLVSFVDVQGGANARFIAHVFAVGAHKEKWLIDRYQITESKRDAGDGLLAPIDPAAHGEDWDVITEKVVQSTYRTTVPGRELRMHLTLVDAGGEDGVSDKAYAWARRLRTAGLLQRSVRLTKGHGGKVDWHYRETYVGGKQGKGDVPLWLLSPNKLKDMVAAGRRRRVPGPGYYHLPTPKGPANPDGWLPAAVLEELDAEVRGDDGQRVQIKKRNELLDGAANVEAGLMMLGCDRKGFWDAPPLWALPLDAGNSGVITAEERRAERAAAPPVKEWGRRSARSAYLDG
jgi:phage terminase large subunit GpA-like protein